MKLLRKITSTVLILAMILSIVSITVTAQTAEKVQKSDTFPTQAYAIAELKDQRTADSKRFLMSDKSIRAVVYSDNVHYKENGQWKDVDSSMSLADAEDREDFDGFSTVENSFKVKVAKNANAKKLVRIKTDSYGISWGYSNSNPVRKTFCGANIENVADDTGDMIYDSVKKSTQKVTYSNIDSDCDLEYIITGSSVKENIIVKSKRDNYDFSFDIQTKNVSLELEDNNIYGKNSKNETVFTIPAPFMFDSENDFSDLVTYSLSQKNNNKYTLTITADSEWLNSDDRAFPVTIDPVVVTEQKSKSLDTAFITSSKPNTNHSDKAELLVGKESSEYGNCRAMVKFKLPALSAGDMVVNAKLCFVAFANDGSFYDTTTPDLQVNAHMINKSWNYKTVTWNNCPSTSNTVLDYDYITRKDNKGNWKYFNITKAVKQWYEGGTDSSGNYVKNNGIMLKSYNENGSYADAGVKGELFSERYGANPNALPAIIINYINNKGLEDYWTYTTASAGIAGNISVNDYTGNLVVTHDDVSTAGLNMPITIQHVYNGYTYDKGTFNEIMPKMGHGWRLNIEQTVRETKKIPGFNSDTAAKYPYVYTDADGTDHYFLKKTENNVARYLDENGQKMELKKTSSGYTIENSIDKSSGKTIYSFNSSGNLSQIKDSNGNKMTVTYSGNQITSVSDGSGHKIIISDNTQTKSGNIRSMTDPEQKITYFYFNEKGFCQIKYPDGKTATYDYDSDGALSSLQSSDGSKVIIEYTPKSLGKRVKSLTEYGQNGELGQCIKFDRSEYNTTKITTSGVDGIIGNSDDITNTYQFDNFGRTISVQSSKSGSNYGASTYQYSSATVNSDASNINQLNKLTGYASIGRNTLNHVLNGNAESATYWKSARWVNDCTYTFGTSTEQKLFGNSSFKLNSTAVTGDGRARIYQDFDTKAIVPGGQYTFSAYVKTSNITVANGTDNGKNCGACLNVNVFTENNSNDISQYAEMVTGTTDTQINNGWVRISTTVTIPNNVTSTRLNLAIRNATGTAFFDGIQVEGAGVANSFNMLNNPSFERLSSGSKGILWDYGNISSTDICNSQNVKQGSYSYKIVGEASKKKEVYQFVPVSGSESDTYIVSGWAKADAVPATNSNRKFKISITVTYSDGTAVVKPPAEFNTSVSGWQYTSRAFNLDDGTSANKKPVKIGIYVRYWCGANTAYFDNIQLIKDNAQSYTYDKDGNLVTIAKNAENKSSMEYSNTNLIKETDVNGNSFSYTYDSKHNMTQAKSQRGIKYDYKYNSQGNATELVVSNSSGNSKIKTEASYYGTNNSFLKSVTDENGNKTEYDYNTVNGLLNSTTNAKGIKTSYEYDASQRISKVSNGSSSISYSYDGKSQLSSINDNSGTKYSFTYDGFGNVLETSVGTRKLIANQYNARNNGLSRSTYGNGDYVDYVYNAFGKISEKKVNGVSRYKWYHDSGANLSKYVDNVNNICYNYTYDSTGRLIRQYASSGTVASNINARLYTTEYGYDKMNNVVKVVNKAGGRTQKVTNKFYAKDNLPEQSLIYSNRHVTFGHDTLNRLNKKIISTESPVYIDYVYQSSDRNTDTDSSYTTRLINKEYIGDTVYRYTYDKLGNIIKIEQGERTNKSSNQTADGNYQTLVEYVYDGNNQLVRENNKKQNKTVMYNYDDKGNRTARYEFVYFTDNPPAPPTVSTYMDYSDSGWGDLLTKVYGSVNSNLTYDEIGNPTSYFGYDMSWTGRQLDSINGNDLSVSYKYDADGLRTEKTVNGVSSKYYYVGGTLYYEKRGAKELYYFYDAHGTLMMIKLYDGESELNYYVSTNSRGDVENLYRGDGSIKAHYVYDTWGKVLSVTDENGNEITDANNIGLLNPIRYRGYYYDSETGYYYVSSRYYDPEIGRFLNADIQETLTADFENFSQYNLFAYCFNNPVNMSDETGTWPIWAKKVVAAVAIVAVVAAVAAVTVATAGAGTAAAVIAVGAAKGAAIGMASGAAIGAATGAMRHRVSTGSWSGADTAALNGMGDGALSGAVSGAMTGAAGSAVKVAQAAKAWDSGTFKSGYQSMKYHYNKHVINAGLTKGNNVLRYTRDAVSFANRNSSLLKYTYNYNYGNASWNLTYSTGRGGMFTRTGKILTFWYR